MKYTLDEQQCRNLVISSRKEWLLTNAIGGYSMGTAAGLNTRRYHGHLIAAITPPTGRMNLLAAIEEMVLVAGQSVGISSNQYPGTVYPDGYAYLTSFSVGESAVWRYRVQGAEIEKELALHQDMNVAFIRYRNVGKIPISLSLRPLVQHRDHHSNFHESPAYPDRLVFGTNSTVIEQGGVSLHIDHLAADRNPVQGWYFRFEHARESDRGLESRDDLFCPCELSYALPPGSSAELIVSTGGEVQDRLPISGPKPDRTLAALLTQSASKFQIATSQRKTLIAGYPWFTDWGRDTMISLPGLCLHTGKVDDAKQILRDYSEQMFQGLIPNRFVEKGERPDYNTVDATLWFANAIYKTLNMAWDEPFAEKMLGALREVFDWHTKGTLFGIKVDPADGLLTQGEQGVQLTWMDAKVGDWVVTPRHGKPVEINGLWINALRSMEWIADRLPRHKAESATYRAAAEKAEQNFESKFWHEARGHYVDTVDPIDVSLRPNQLIPMALPFSAIDPEHAKRALAVVARELLTPGGVRTLGPNEPGYRGRYSGHLAELDASYHQGTAWPWLLGSYATAIVRYTQDRREAKRILRNAKTMLSECGLGGISEVYDGDEPQNPGGCPFQAWSTAEILRAWIEDVGGE